MNAPRSLRLASVLLLGMILVNAGPASGRIRYDPVKIRLAGVPGPFMAWDRYEGVLEIEAVRDVTIENLQIVSEDLSLEHEAVASTLSLARGERISVSFSTVPLKVEGRIGITYEADGKTYTTTLSPAQIVDTAANWTSEVKPAAGSPHTGETLRWPDRKLPVETEADHPDPFLDEDDAKAEAGALSRTIRVKGVFFYVRGDGVPVFASDVPFKVYDEDSGLDEELASGTLDVTGAFDVTFTWDPCGVCDTNPDIYVELASKNGDIEVQTAWLEWTYYWDSWVVDDFTGDFIDFGGMVIDNNQPAVHMFRMLKSAFALYDAQGYNLDQVDVQWPADNTEFSPLTDEIFVTKERQWEEGSYFHELGHHWQHQFTYTLTPDYENGYCDDPDPGHCMWCEEEENTAHLEGIANFLSYMVGDHLRDSMFPPPASWRREETVFDCSSSGCTCEPAFTEGYIFAFLIDLADSDNDNDTTFTNTWADVADLNGWALVSIIDLERPHNLDDWWPYLAAWFPGELEQMWETGMNNQFNFDSLPPALVSDLHSSSHGVGTPSSDATIAFNWTTPPDDASGIAGYSYAVSQDVPGTPPLTMNLGDVQFFETAALAPGTYYFSLRSFDRNDRYSVSYYTVGPYVIREPYLSDLIFHDPGNWPLVLVPYPDWYSDPGGPPAPYALEGWTGTTYWNYSGKNNGESAIPETFTNRLFVDGVFTDENVLAGGSPWMDFAFKNRGPVVVKGGRHTFQCVLDQSEVVPETNETNNGIAYQYVWSGKDLMPGMDETGGAPPDPTAGWDDLVNLAGFNADGYRFFASGWWNAVTMRTHEHDTAYQLQLHEPSTGPDDGFGASLAWSAEPKGRLNAVFVNSNQIPPQDWDIGVLNGDGDGDSFYTLRHVESIQHGQTGPVAFNWTSSDFLSLYEIQVPSHDEGVISVTLQTDFPNQAVWLGWLDQNFTTGTLLDARETAFTDMAGFARLDLDIERLGMHCFVVWRDPAYGSAPMNLTLDVFQTPADFIPDLPSNWYAPIVPRPFYAQTPYVVSEPDTLYGDGDQFEGTWLSFAAKNIGPQDGDGVPSWIYLDGEPLWSHEWFVLLSGIAEKEFLDNMFSIPAGRHTLSYHVDDPDQNTEMSETNNIFGEQWVWGPRAAETSGVFYRAAPPERQGGWGDIGTGEVPSFNCDGLRLSAPDTTGWQAFAVMPGDVSNVDVRLYERGAGAKSGFEVNLERSSWGPEQLDYILVKYPVTPGPDYDVGIINAGGESGYYYCVQGAEEWAEPLGTHGPYNLGQTGFIHLFEFDLLPDIYQFTLSPTSGLIKWGMSLHDGVQPFHSRSTTLPDGTSWYNGPGEGEEMIVEVTEAGPYCLTVWSADPSGLWDYGEYTVTVGLASGVGVAATPPDLSSRLGVHPNPFNRSTTVSYVLEQESPVDLAVFNVRGERVCTLVSKPMPAGRHEVVWSGRQEDGRVSSSGIYFLRLVAGSVGEVRKILLLP